MKTAIAQVDSYWGKVMENLANELAVCHNNDLARRRAMSLRSVGRDLIRAADELSKRSIETIVNQVPR